MSASSARFLSPDNRINSQFIADNEGGQYLQGYVPNRGGQPIGSSGVTIATGVDLGGRTDDSLRDMGIDDALVAQLHPYLGLKGDQAAGYLQQHPLEITADQASQLDNAAINAIAGRLQQLYDDDSAIDFWTLPENTQTAIADLAYQYGPNLPSATPIFWSEITQGQWQMAVGELYDFHDPYGPRRAAEGALIQSDIDHHLLPPITTGLLG